MHYLTFLIGSLLTMLGYREPQGQTSIVRISGEAAVLSRTTVSGGLARFQAMVAAAPAITAASGAERNAAGAGVAGLSQEELAMCRAFDMKPEDFAAAKAKE